MTKHKTERKSWQVKCFPPSFKKTTLLARTENCELFINTLLTSSHLRRTLTLRPPRFRDYQWLINRFIKYSESRRKRFYCQPDLEFTSIKRLVISMTILSIQVMIFMMDHCGVSKSSVNMRWILGPLLFPVIFLCFIYNVSGIWFRL